MSTSPRKVFHHHVSTSNVDRLLSAAAARGSVDEYYGRLLRHHYAIYRRGMRAHTPTADYNNARLAEATSSLKITARAHVKSNSI